jgi:hypothetical protein
MLLVSLMDFVGVRYPKANELLQGRQNELRQQKGSCTKSDANSCPNFSSRPRGACVGLFIGRSMVLLQYHECP